MISRVLARDCEVVKTVDELVVGNAGSRIWIVCTTSVSPLYVVFDISYKLSVCIE